MSPTPSPFKDWNRETALRVEREAKPEYQLVKQITDASVDNVDVSENGSCISILNSSNKVNLVFDFHKRTLTLPDGAKIKIQFYVDIPRLQAADKNAINNITKELGKKLRVIPAQFLSREIIKLIDPTDSQNKQDTNNLLRERLRTELGNFFEVNKLHQTTIFKEYILANLKSKHDLISQAIAQNEQVEDETKQVSADVLKPINPSPQVESKTNREKWEEKFQIGDRLIKKGAYHPALSGPDVLKYEGISENEIVSLRVIERNGQSYSGTDSSQGISVQRINAESYMLESEYLEGLQRRSQAEAQEKAETKRFREQLEYSLRKYLYKFGYQLDTPTQGTTYSKYTHFDRLKIERISSGKATIRFNRSDISFTPTDIGSDLQGKLEQWLGYNKISLCDSKHEALIKRALAQKGFAMPLGIFADPGLNLPPILSARQQSEEIENECRSDFQPARVDGNKQIFRTWLISNGVLELSPNKTFDLEVDFEELVLQFEGAVKILFEDADTANFDFAPRLEHGFSRGQSEDGGSYILLDGYSSKANSVASYTTYSSDPMRVYTTEYGIFPSISVKVFADGWVENYANLYRVVTNSSSEYNDSGSGSTLGSFWHD